ncbi:unnamed protein product [Parascedosporium putredinis]|uniref:Major facilitator superfamily (MFS) profile domain-containing protein n=1 Tax=Parascedosporium putredinis TaxID=1442378 RepID=A0A9P1GY94_9PEZI|nr:unnamed protein product [Parascedosporium putredinis]CAI7990546.1 unnamed protein product [Parascedosporium putredinis]
MADIFGRHGTVQVATILMLVGSALCTAAPTNAFGLLLFGRAVQGIACAGLDVVIRVILADKVSLRESATNWTIFSTVGGISYGLGPIVGGYLVETDWRWCFGINLPVAAVGMVLIAFVVRKELLGPQPIPQLPEATETGRKDRLAYRLKTVDYWGQVLFLFGFGLVVLALTWAGPIYAWDSPAVLVPLCVGVATTIAWGAWEFLMTPQRTLGLKWSWKTPMVRWDILTDRNVGLLVFSSLSAGMAMFSVFYFCSIYFILVLGKDPTDAGISLLFFTPGVGAGVYGSSFMTRIWPRTTYSPILLGAVCQAVGIGVLAWALWAERKPVIYGMVALIGAGSGFRFISLPLHDKAGVEEVKRAIVWAYIAILPFMVLCAFSSAFLGAVILPKGKGSAQDRSNNIIIRQPYPWALFRGTSSDKESWEHVGDNEMDNLVPAQPAAWVGGEPAYDPYNPPPGSEAMAARSDGRRTDGEGGQDRPERAWREDVEGAR